MTSQQLNIDGFAPAEPSTEMSIEWLNKSLKSAIWRKDDDYLVACDPDGNILLSNGRAIRRKELTVDLTERELARAVRRYPELAAVAHGVASGRMAVTVYMADTLVQKAGCKDGMADTQIIDALRQHISGGRT